MVKNRKKRGKQYGLDFVSQTIEDLNRQGQEVMERV